MAAAVEAPILSEPHMPPPPPMSVSKQNRILIWRREVASALDDAASAASTTSSSSSSTAASSAYTSAAPTTSISPNGLPPAASAFAKADSPTSSFSSTSSRRRALWNRLSRRFAIHHGPDSAAAPVESPRTAMYRDTPPDAALALEGLTVVDSGPDPPLDEAHVQPEAEANEAQQPLGDESSSDGGGRGLRERQERLQRAARLLQHGPRKEDRALAVSVRT